VADIHNLVDKKNDQANKENAPVGAEQNEVQAANEMAANASNNPDDIKKLEELQKQNEEIAKQKEMHAQENEQLQNELLTKEQALELEKKQKEELSALIQ
jgi:hypothetical protein